MKQYAKEKLAVRKASRELVVEIFRLVDAFPQKIKITLGVELKKSAATLTSYVTEGSSRHDFEESEQVLILAYEMLVQISNNLLIAKKLNAAPQKHFEILHLRIKDLAVKINEVTKPEEG